MTNYPNKFFDRLYALKSNEPHIFLAGLSAASTILNRRIHIDFGGAVAMGHMYMIGVAKTGSGKSTVTGVTKDILKSQPLLHVSNFVPSFEAIAQTMRKKTGEHPEMQGKKMVQVPDYTTVPCALVLSEFNHIGKLLANDNRGFLEGLNDSFQIRGPVAIDGINVKKRNNDEELVLDPFILSILGTMVDTQFCEFFGNDIVASSGFLNRFLVLPFPEFEFDLGLDAKENVSEKLTQLGESLHTSLRIHGTPRQVMTEAAIAKLQIEVDTLFKPYWTETALNSIRHKRTLQHVYSLAGIFALTDEREKIDVQDIEWAVQTVKDAIKTKDELFALGEERGTEIRNPDQKRRSTLKEKITEFIEANPNCTWSMIYKARTKGNSKYSRSDCAEAVSNLLREGVIAETAGNNNTRMFTVKA